LDSRPFHCRIAWVNSAFHPSQVGKLSTRLRAGIRRHRGSSGTSGLEKRSCIYTANCCRLSSLCEGKKEVKHGTLIAPQVDNAAAEALRYMARTKMHAASHIPALYTSPAVQPVPIYQPRKDGGLSKPRPWVQRATGPRLLRDTP